MSIRDELTKLQNTSANIKNQIVLKGQDVLARDSWVHLVPKIDAIDNSSTSAYTQVVLKEVLEDTIEDLYDETLNYIRPNCFQYCTLLKKAELTNITKIGSKAFTCCFNLKELIIDTPYFCKLDNTNAFDYTQLESIYVTDKFIEQYRNDPVWSQLTNKIKLCSKQKCNPNLLVNSANWFNTVGSANSGSTGTTQQASLISGNWVHGDKGLQLIISNASSTSTGAIGRYYVANTQLGTTASTILEQNELYTYSFWGRSDEGCKLGISPICESQTRTDYSGPSEGSNFILTPQWKKYTVTFKFTRTDKLTACFYIYGITGTQSTAQFSQLKLEKGNMATAWCPNVNDTYNWI